MTTDTPAPEGAEEIARRSDQAQVWMYRAGQLARDDISIANALEDAYTEGVQFLRKAYEQRADRAEATLAAKDEEIARLREQLAQSDDNAGALANDALAFSRVLAELACVPDDLEGAVIAIHEMRMQRDEAESEVTRLREEVTRAEKVIDTFVRAQEHYREAMDERNELKNRMRLAESEVARLKEQIYPLQNELRAGAETVERSNEWRERAITAEASNTRLKAELIDARNLIDTGHADVAAEKLRAAIRSDASKLPAAGGDATATRRAVDAGVLRSGHLSRSRGALRPLP